MCFVLSQHCFCFERIGTPEEDYFNINDYLIYSNEDRQNLINADLYTANDFLLIPTLDHNEIAAWYLLEKNNKKLWRKRHNDTFFNEFHNFIEDELLLHDWQTFERNKLLEFAVEWCHENQIKYTLKKASGFNKSK